MSGIFRKKSVGVFTWSVLVASPLWGLVSESATEQALNHISMNPNNEGQPDDPLLSLREVSARLGYKSKTNHTVLRLIKQKKLRAYQPNSRVIKVRRSELQRYIRECEGLAA